MRGRIGSTTPGQPLTVDNINETPVERKDEMTPQASPADETPIVATDPVPSLQTAINEMEEQERLEREYEEGRRAQQTEYESLVDDGIVFKPINEARRESQIEEEAIPPINERKPTKYEYQGSNPSETDGGFRMRAGKLIQAFDHEAPGPTYNTGLFQDPKYRKAKESGFSLLTDQEREAVQAQERPMVSILERINVIEEKNGSRKLTNSFAGLASAVVENNILNYFKTVDEEPVLTPDDKDRQPQMPDEIDWRKHYAMSDINRRIGVDLVREAQRYQGKKEIEDPTAQEALLLGDFVLRVYQEVNSDLLEKADDLDTKVNRYRPTKKGEKIYAKAQHDLAKIFPRQYVEPFLKPPLFGRLVGQAKTLVKPLVKAAKSSPVYKAMQNISTVDHHVDTQRSKILLSTLIPGMLDMGGDLTDFYKSINLIGKEKMDEFLAEEAEKKNQGYNAEAVMATYKDRIAQYLAAIARGYNRSNYLTYFFQGFSGRIQPQQSLFNPVISKHVRAVTRSANPVTIVKGSRAYKNLRQMYAMMLVPDADMALPEERERLLNQETQKLLEMGKRLQEVLEGTMDDLTVGRIFDAIKNGVALNNDMFPEFKPLQLNPSNPIDAEIIKLATKKGEDAIGYMDGLIDFANYYETVEQNGKTYYTYFNAYIDGKTNGLASWGMLVGSRAMAFMTGVMRLNTTQLLDDGDIRDAVATKLTQRLDEEADNGDGGLFKIRDENKGVYKLQVESMARALFNLKLLNKYTTMTFGYGRDVGQFKKDLVKYGNLLIQETQRLADEGKMIEIEERGLQAFINPPEKMSNLADMFFEPYKEVIEEVLSDDAIQARGLMRAVATVFGLTDLPFTMTGPTGMEHTLGGVVMETYEEAETLRYNVYKSESGEASDARVREKKAIKEQPKIPNYRVKKRTAASSDFNKNPDGTMDVTVGRKAINGAVVAPIQALDAATVIRSFIGSSWEKITAAGKGKPYVLSIYDAFKFDANTYDAVLEVVNDNWFNYTLDWDLFKAFKDSYQYANQRLSEKLSSLNNNEMYSIEPGSDFAMLTELLRPGFHEVNDDVIVYPYGLMRLFAGLPKANSPEYSPMASALDIYYDYNNENPSAPDKLSGREIKLIVNAIVRELELPAQLTNAQTKANNNKKSLRSEIKKLGTKVYQYYSH